MKRQAKWLAPLGILALGAAVVALLVIGRPEVARQRPPESAPLVNVVEVTPQSARLSVRTHGTVVPRTESDLVPQVSGEVVWVSPSLASGGFFAKGAALVRIDRADASVELSAARAAVARAESEAATAATELARQRRLFEEGVASQARIDDAENRAQVTGAQLQEARARLQRAERDLSRTVLRAPYEGRVRSESVDVGQFVSRGQPIARIYAVDRAEVRLPVPDRELQFLDGFALGSGGVDPERAPEVVLRAEFAGEPRSWRGRIVRTEGEIDARSRMVNLVAGVDDPYGLHDGGSERGVPLAVGLFVEAEILGRELEGVFALPRAALRPSLPGEPERVLVVDDESKLRLREVEVLRRERERVLIGAGLAAGERVAVTPIQAVVDGMRVRVAGSRASEGAAGEPARTARAGAES